MIRLRIAGVCCTIIAGFTGLCSQAAAATYAELAKYLPNDANAVVVVNAAAIYASPLGTREGWQKKYADGFDASPLILPPSAERGLLAAALDLSTLRPDWEAAAMELSIDPSAGDVAKRRGGHIDVIGGLQAAWLSSKLCVLKFAPHVFGVITPTNRQEATHWATAAKAGQSGALAAYLSGAVSVADTDRFQVVLAVDLAGAFAEANLRTAAAQAEALKGISPDVAAKILASIQGVKFGVVVGENLVGRVQLDFAEEVGPLGAVAKPVVLKALAKAGAILPEFASWDAKPGPRSLALEGELTEDGMRRIFSLLALDAGTIESSEPDRATSTTVSAEETNKVVVAATLRYFHGVGKYVDDISRLQKAASLDQAVFWVENYARRVELLSTRNVDPELVQYGKYVADTFRSIVDEASGWQAQYVMASEPVMTNYRIGYLPTARTVNYGGNFERMYAPYGYADYDPQAQQANMTTFEKQVTEGVQQATKTLQQLQADQETVRAKLSTKYGITF